MLKLPKIKNLLSRYRNDERGNVAMLFAGSAVVVIGTMGAAMDYSTLSNAKARSQAIADATALSAAIFVKDNDRCLLYTSPSPRDKRQSRMPSSA